MNLWPVEHFFPHFLIGPYFSDCKKCISLGWRSLKIYLNPQLQKPFQIKNEMKSNLKNIPGNVSEIMLKISMNWAPKRVPSLLRSWFPKTQLGVFAVFKVS